MSVVYLWGLMIEGKTLIIKKHLRTSSKEQIAQTTGTTLMKLTRVLLTLKS